MAECYVCTSKLAICKSRKGIPLCEPCFKWVPKRAQRESRGRLPLPKVDFGVPGMTRPPFVLDGDLSRIDWSTFAAPL
jgi:hypothetical protein